MTEKLFTGTLNKNQSKTKKNNPDDNLKKVFAYFDFENSQSKISRTLLQTRFADTG